MNRFISHLLLATFLLTQGLHLVSAQANGCTDNSSCNFDAEAIADDGSCEYCSCPEVVVPTVYDFGSDATGYGLRVELVAQHNDTGFGLSSLAGMNTYRFYAVTPNPGDKVTAVIGSTSAGALVLNAPGGLYQHPFGSITGTGIQSLLINLGYPELEYDSWVTIGADRTPNELGFGYSAVSAVADPAENWVPLFEPGGGVQGESFSMTTSVGGGWFTYPTAANSVPDSLGQVLIGQFTSSGPLSGTMTLQFLLGDEVLVGDTGLYETDFRPNIAFDTQGLGEPVWEQTEGCPCEADLDGDGICEPYDACTDLTACNYDDPYNVDCKYVDSCGNCGGSGIPAGDCDCNGNQVDAVGDCGGNCAADADADGICDDVDDCVGEYDACGLCNGPGAIYDCGCTGIPVGDCDCNGNQLDAIGICGGTCTSNVDGDSVCDDAEVPGCMNPYACNYDPAATDDDGSCAQVDVLDECGGTCTSDADGDGICDDVDDCVGTLDACGICNGPGEIYACGCSGIPIR